MRFFSYVKDAWKTIMANKMRSGLSTLGIVIGMMSVIVMMAIGQGAEQQILQQMGDLLKNKFTVVAGGGYSRWNEESDGPGQYIKSISFSTDLIPYIEEYFPDLKGKMLYEIDVDSPEIKVGTKKDRASIVGIPQNWFTLNEKQLSEGFLFDADHYEKKSFVAVVNHKFKDTFFKKGTPIGKKIRAGKKEYTIIGVLKKDDFDRQSMLYIPDSTALERVLHKNRLQQFQVFLEPDWDNQIWQNRVMYLLLKKFNRTDQASSGIEIWSSRKGAEEFKKSSDMFRYLLLGIGAISLLVGGIGVMNIMVVSVTERTREIGIRKAIGALNRDIVLQFLIESVVITLIGGVIAFLLSYGIVYALNRFVFTGGEMGEFRAVIDLKVVILAFSLTTFTGIIFGILPARKAAKLRPIDALRFE